LQCSTYITPQNERFTLAVLDLRRAPVVGGAIIVTSFSCAIRFSGQYARIELGREEPAMSPTTNRQVRLKSRPAAIPQAEHFEIVETPLPELRDGQILVRNQYLSVDPAMRGWVSAVGNYAKPVAIGEVMRSFASGEADAIAGLYRGENLGKRLVRLH